MSGDDKVIAIFFICVAAVVITGMICAAATGKF